MKAYTNFILKNLFLALIFSFSLHSNSYAAYSEYIDTSFDTKTILENTNLTDTQKSKLLTEQAEWILTSKDFFLVYPLFKKALELDANNSKAKLYLTLFKPHMNLRGIITKMSGIIEKKPELLPKWNNYIHYLKGAHHPQYLAFLMESAPKYTKESDITEFNTQVMKDLVNQQNDLEKMKDKFPLYLNLNESLGGYNKSYGPKDIDEDPLASNEDKINPLGTCLLEVKGSVYTLKKCKVTNHVVKVDEYDADYFSLITNYLLVYASIFDSYDMDGTLLKAIQYNDGKVRSDEAQRLRIQKAFKEILAEDNNFGKLISPHKVSLMSYFGKNALTNARKVLSQIKQNCTSDKKNSYEVRLASSNYIPYAECMDTYLSPKGSQIIDQLPSLNKLIESGTSVFKFLSQKKSEKPTVIEVDFNHITDFTDLKKLGPQMDKCGHISFTDNTLFGIFPSKPNFLSKDPDPKCRN